MRNPSAHLRPCAGGLAGLPYIRRLGTDAEDRAASYLLERGFTIVTRRYKARRGELDLVALDGEKLVFVEVKERLAAGYVPEESIGAVKARRLAMAAEEYLVSTGEVGREIRFDTVCIDREGIRHHVDAFR